MIQSELDFFESLKAKSDKSVYLHVRGKNDSVYFVNEDLSAEIAQKGVKTVVVRSFVFSLLYVIFFRSHFHILNLNRGWLSLFSENTLMYLHGMPQQQMSLVRYHYINLLYTIASVRCLAVIGVSKMVISDWLAKYAKTEGEQAYLIHNKIPKVFMDRMQGLKSRERSVDFIYIGRCTEGKNINLICMVFDILSSLGYRCEIYGFPKVLSCHYMGPLSYPDGVAECFSKAKSFISLNQYEPFGLTVVEAHAAGCFVFATKNTGALEVMESSDYQILDENNNPYQIVQEILTLN